MSKISFPVRALDMADGRQHYNLQKTTRATLIEDRSRHTDRMSLFPGGYLFTTGVSAKTVTLGFFIWRQLFLQADNLIRLSLFSYQMSVERRIELQLSSLFRLDLDGDHTSVAFLGTNQEGSLCPQIAERYVSP